MATSVDPAITVFVDNQRPSGSQQNSANEQFLGRLIAIGPAIAVSKTVVDASGRNVTYIPARVLTVQEVHAIDTGKAYASFLYNRYDSLFFHNGVAESGFQRSVSTVLANEKQDKIDFATHFANPDFTYLPQARTVAIEGLQVRANQGTPAPPAKLFGFVPLKVPGVVQNLSNLGVIVAGAYGPGLLAPEAAGATTSAGVSTSVVGSSVEAGGFAGELGIRGAQAVSLASTSTPGISAASAFGVEGLSSSGLALGAAGGVIETAPVLASVSPMAANLGLNTVTTQPGLFDQIGEFLKNQVRQVADTVQQNPVKSGLSAAGTALTAKQIADSSNPLAALVNTVSGALGLGPIIKPTPTPGPGSLPPNLVPGYGGGGSGGGGGSYGGAVVTDTGNMVLPLMGIVVGILFVLVLARR